jgi:hypothetical protein
MSTIVGSADDADMETLVSSRRELVGYRYLRWSHYVEPSLTAERKAQALDKFGAEFESLPRDLEPYDGVGRNHVLPV